jgi:prepilin-type N-terminal cleavage/methylation domain-containing protein
MSNQRGVTLVELLVTITIMVVVLAPIITLVTVVLTTHNDVSESNELQHEARLIIEYMTLKVRDGASWDPTTKKLVSESQVEMWYDENNGRLFRGDTGSNVLSEDVQLFSVHDNGNKLTVHLVLYKGAFETQYELNTTIYKREKQIDL